MSRTATLGRAQVAAVVVMVAMIAIMAMICLGYLTRYSGMDAVMGLAMTHTGVLYPIFGSLIGWLGVALTGTDAGSNALFGSLQVITANKLGLSPVLMAAANTPPGPGRAAPPFPRRRHVCGAGVRRRRAVVTGCRGGGAAHAAAGIAALGVARDSGLGTEVEASLA